MPQSPKPLNLQQQELIRVVKTTHANLLVARRLKQAETARRIEEARITYTRQLEEAEARIHIDMDAEIVAHERAEDSAILAAYNSGVPVKRIAEDGFGNRFPGAVHAKISELRNQGLVGNKVDYQHREDDDSTVRVEFPVALDVNSYLGLTSEVTAPEFSMPFTLVLIPADNDGENEVTVSAVTLTMHPRDPYFATIEKNARPNTPFRNARTATLYIHPFSKELMARESRELGEVYWDHPVARWVKDNPEAALAGYNTALSLNA